MNIENALDALRAGKKIWHPGMGEDEYYQGCYIGIKNELFGLPPESFEDIKARGMGIVWMKDGKEHPEMRPRWNMYDPKTDPCKHGMYPMINLLWLMSDEWKIYD